MRYEYKVVELQRMSAGLGTEVSKLLNSLSAEGWDYCNSIPTLERYALLVFRRVCE